MGNVRQVVHQLFEEILERKDFDDDTSFFEIGGQSILLGVLQDELAKKLNLNLSFEELFEFSTVNEITSLADNITNNIIENVEQSNFKIHPERRFDDYPMTELQMAYYVGRQSETELGGNPTRGYSEIECCEYEHDRMVKAIQKLFDCHDILRSRFCDNGIVKIEKEYKVNDIPYEDISAMPEEEQKEYLLQKRNRMFDTPYEIDKLPLVRFEATKVSPDKTILHFSHDGLIIDGWSHETVVQDLDKYYTDPDKDYKMPEILFRDYVDYLNQVRDTKKYKEDKKYWLDKIDEYPEAPQLPLLVEPSVVKDVRTRQVVRKISNSDWKKVRDYAANNKLTPFAVLFTAFSKAIAKYSEDEDFVINMPVTIRPHIHPEIGDMIGECSNFFLFHYQSAENESILENAKKNQRQVSEIMEHNLFMGTDFIREMQKKKGGNIAAPIVFTSIVDVPEAKLNNLKRVYTKTHTSQVWIDAIAMRYPDGIMLTMDCVEQLFSNETVEGIGDSFVDALKMIVEDENSWSNNTGLSLSSKELNIIADCISGEQSVSLPLVSELFHKAYETYPTNIAIADEFGTLTYKEAYQQAACIAKKMKEIVSQSVHKEIGIFLGKGRKSILAIIAAVMNNYAFLPFDVSAPIEDVKYCVNNVQLQLVVTETDWYSMLSEELQCPLLNIDEIDLNEEQSVEFAESKKDDDVFIINTSGTTGRSKSIRIKQEGLVNCVLETNKTYHITEKDKAIAVTNICHDIAQYDIFGMLMCGGTIVVPSENKKKDPYHWSDLINRYQVTFWASVPALVEILVECGKESLKDDIKSLRHILTGGDYVQASLVKRIQQLNSQIEVVSVGGPSETTIWNIWHPVSKEDIENGIIPYGKPVAHTRTYILNKSGHLCPPGVKGTMFSSGVGVAKEYIGLPEETKKKFTYYNNERVYNTGDLGYYRNDGNIIIIGREDNQIKINGKRIEINGIQKILSTYRGIKQSAVIKSSKYNYLVAFYVTEEDNVRDEIKSYMEKYLPDYMIPVDFIKVEKMPLTFNGKVDIKALDKNYKRTEVKENMQKISSYEREIIDMCCSVLNIGEISDINESFFDMGGNSISAIKLLAQFRKKYNVKMTIYDILNTPYIKEWARQIASSATTEDDQEQDAQQTEFTLTKTLEELWLHDMLLHTAKSTLGATIQIEGNIDVSKFKQAIVDTVRANKAFQFRFTLNKETKRPIARIVEEDPYVPFVYMEGIPEKQIEKIECEQTQIMFDLESEPLYKVTLIKKQDGGYELILIMHHIIADEQSFLIFFNQIMNRYYGKEVESDSWEFSRYLIDKQKANDDVTEYVEKLANKEPLMLNGNATAAEGADCVRFLITKEQSEQLRTLCSKLDTSLYDGLLSVFAIVLSELSGQEEICISAPFSDRGCGSYENTIGMFICKVILDFSIKKENCFEDVLKEAKQKVLRAFKQTSESFYNQVREKGYDKKMKNLSNHINFNMIDSEKTTEYGSLEYITSDVSKNELALHMFIEKVGEEYRSNLFFQNNFINKDYATLIVDRFVELIDLCVQRPKDEIKLYYKDNKMEKTEKENSEEVSVSSNTEAIIQAGDISDITAKVKKAWQATLNISDIPVNTGFFELGGYSMLLYDLKDQIEKETGVEISVVELLTYTTVSKIAEFIIKNNQSKTPKEEKKEELVSKKQNRHARKRPQRLS